MRRVFGLTIAVFLASSLSAKAEYVVNGGFETGDLTGWTVTGDPSFIGALPGIQNAGTYGAYLGPYGALSYLSQTLATPANKTVELTFELQSTPVPTGYSEPAGSSEFSVSWDGSTVLDLVNPPAFGYTQYSITLNTIGNDVLSFGARNDASFFYLDDVSVPEPASIAMMLAGLAGLAGLSRRARRM